MWDENSARKAVRALYDETADDLDIPELRDVSSHVWRSMLNSEWINKGVPVEWRSAYLGHGEDINRSAYTDFVDMKEFVKLVRGE